MQINNVHRVPGSLLQELAWIDQHRRRVSMSHALYKLSLEATVYHIRKERNFHIFQNKSDGMDAVVKRTADIWFCISSWRNKRSSINQNLCLVWNISCKIFAISQVEL